MNLRTLFTFLLIGSMAPAVAEGAEATADDERYQRCVYSRSIRSADVLNDDYIVFRLVGGKVYLNQMPKTCRGLSRDRRFTYELSERRLCRGDRIRVLMDAGSDMIEGRSCKLGEFRRLTDDEISYLYSPEPVTVEPKPVPSPEVEEMERRESGSED
ncbi:MAG: hypothetical protein ACE5F8_06435 [Woeseiaceae bacterium]